MALETVVDMNQNGDWAPAKYVRYTHPDERELTEKDLLMKKDSHIEGYYLKSQQRESKYGMRYNHTLVQEDGLHLVIPDNKDVTKAFLSDRMVKGAFTRFTYLGKNSFEYKDENGKTGTAKAVKVLIQQDKDNTVSFEGNEGCEKIVGKQTTAKLTPSESGITTADVPF